MRIIGLTGGLGSGKSTVSEMLRELGATVVDADEGARVVVEPGQPALAEIRQRFGDGVFAGDGGLDREKLADVVFRDERAREDLNAITHPRVRAWMAERMQDAAAAGAPAVVLDIPLLFESGLTAGLDDIVVVWAPVEEQFKRAVARGLRGEDARARIKAQMPIDEKRDKATVVIDNSGSKEKTRGQIEKFWGRVRDAQG
ncbi:MAG TPA: dephospho-CoA kinase [Candidatus Solibacter sp.]|jgi:dephospho-CoA kinase|nr:dephospho-CoA kinase [Candidatus Solibacter sp.]